jgi:hypothetical protein
MTIWKLFLITCIAGFAAAAVSIGHAEEASILAPQTAAPQTTPQQCSAASRPMTRPATAYRSRYLRQTPVSYTARRNG